MSTIEVTCNCGWLIRSNDKDAIKAACDEHDKTCPALFKPDVEITP